MDNMQSIQGEKSQWMIVTRAHIRREDYKLTFNGGEVPSVETMVCLRIAIDKNMTMTKHLDKLRNKAIKGLAPLRYAAKQGVTQRGLWPMLPSNSKWAMLGQHHGANPHDKA